MRHPGHRGGPLQPLCPGRKADSTDANGFSLGSEQMVHNAKFSPYTDFHTYSITVMPGIPPSPPEDFLNRTAASFQAFCNPLQCHFITVFWVPIYETSSPKDPCWLFPWYSLSLSLSRIFSFTLQLPSFFPARNYDNLILLQVFPLAEGSPRPPFVSSLRTAALPDGVAFYIDAPLGGLGTDAPGVAPVQQFGLADFPSLQFFGPSSPGAVSPAPSCSVC